MLKLLFNSVAFKFLERFLVVITSLLLTPYFIGEIGTENYALWLLILSIVGWFNVIDLGFPQAIQRQIIRAIELNNTERVNAVFSTGIALFSILGVLAILILFGLVQAPSIFGVDGLARITLVDILLILSIKIFWGFLMNPFHGIFEGLLRFDIDANISSLNSIGKALLVFLLLPIYGIWGAVAATLAADLVTNILKVIYAKKLYPKLAFNSSLITLNEVKDLFSYSKHLIINGVIRMIGRKSDPIIVTHLFDLPSLAIHQIANNLKMHGQSFIGTISGVFSPVFNKMSARNEDMEKKFNQTTNINLFSSTILFSALLMFGKAFIILWVGKEFEYAIYILFVMTFTYLVTNVTESATQILLAQANHKLLPINSFFIAALNIPLAIFLVQYFGLIGVALSGAILNLIFSTYFKIKLFKRYNNFATKPVYKQLLVSLLVVYIFGFLGSYLLVSVNLTSWFELVLYSACTLPFIIITCWIFILDKKLKSLALNILTHKFNILKIRFKHT
jgi:O-antigen/teichoic acid export membrane protein